MKRIKFLATVISIAFILQILAINMFDIFASNNSLMPITISAVTSDSQVITVYVGDEPTLPTEIVVTTQKTTITQNEHGNDVSSTTNSIENIAVTWTSTDFNKEAAGTYIYSATISDEYALGVGVELPTITVEVKAKASADSGHLPMLTSGDGTGTGTSTGTATTLTSETFKAYVAGDPSTLWDYTTATTFNYKVAFTVEPSETADRVFTIDINPHGIVDFPYKISGAPTIEGTNTKAEFSDFYTVLTYTVPVSSLVASITGEQTSAKAGFEIGISLNSSNAETTYRDKSGTFAGAIGHTLLSNLNAKFGVTLDDSKTTPTDGSVDITQRHVPNLYDADESGNLTPWASSNIIGDTAVTGFSVSGKTLKFDHIVTDAERTSGSSFYSLWLASNGKLYFGDGKEFTPSSNENGKITTTILSTTRQLPISGITYTSYNTLNTYVKSDSSFTSGDSLAAIDSFGYKHPTLASPFSSSFLGNEQHYFEGSLPTGTETVNEDETTTFTPTARGISVDIDSIKAAIPNNMTLEQLRKSGVNYITAPTGSQSTISYQQLTVLDTNKTPTDASDDTYGLSTINTTNIPNIVVNIPDYVLVDKLTTEPGSGGNIVDADTETLVFKLENVFPNIKSDPDDPFTTSYAGHTLTIEIPETFEVGQLKITGDDNDEERDFTHFEYFIGESGSGKLTANWNNGILQLPSGMTSLEDVDKIVLYISDTGLNNGQFTEEGAENVTQNYVAYISFTGCKLSEPNVEPNVNGRFETKMEIYLSAPNDGGTYTKLENPSDATNIDDLDMTWFFERPGDPDQDNLTLTLSNTNGGTYQLDNSTRATTVFTAYITQALENGNAMFKTDSRVFKNVEITVTTGQDNHLQLIRALKIYESANSWTFIPIKTISDPLVDNNVVIYYTTNKNPNERSAPVTYGKSTDFELNDSTEYLTSLRIEIDEMQLPAWVTQNVRKTFIEFRYKPLSTVSNGDLPISADDLIDTLTVKMTADNFTFDKIAEADARFSYKVNTAYLNSVSGDASNSSSNHGQKLSLLDADTVINYHIQDSETTTVSSDAEIVKEINSNFPLGSAIYLQLNPKYFEYIGPETSKLTRITGTGDTKWLRYDISGEDGVGSLTIPKDSILVTEELPTADVPLFTAAYLDTSALQAVEYYQNGFVNYIYAYSGVDDTFGITDESDEYYGVTTSSTGLVNIYDLAGNTPVSLTIDPLTSYVQTMSANPQIAVGGHLEYGTKQEGKSVVRYYAHESDYLELGLVLSNSDTLRNNVEVKIVLPSDSSIMSIGLRGDIYTSLSTELKALVGSENNITYYSDEAATKEITGSITYNQVKSVKIIIPTLAANTSTAMPIQLKALPADVYSKPDDTQVDVVATSTLSGNTKLTVSYIFDWYELSGIAFSEKTTDTPNGIYDGDDKYLKELVVSSFKGLNGNPTFSYDNTTGKYSILLQPKDEVYTLVHSPTNDAFTVSTVMPTTSLTLNNNYNGTSGVKFNADITNGLSPVTGSGQNLKQGELNNGNVDLALVETVYTVTFKENKDDTTNVEQYTEVTKNSTIPRTDEYTVPDGKELIGWTEDDTPGTDSTLWDFNDDGGDTSTDTKVTGNITLYPVLIDKGETITVTFDTGDIDTFDSTGNSDFTISSDKFDASKDIAKGGTISKAPTTTDKAGDNKEFDFWYIDANNNNTFDVGETKYSSTVKYNDNTTYVAQYKETSSPPPTGGGGGTTTPPVIEHTVTFEDNDFSDNNIHDKETVPNGDKVSKPTDPTPPTDNDKFVGWYEDEELTIPYDFDDIVTEDITLYPKFEDKETVNVTYEKAEDGTDDTSKDIITGLTPGTDITVDNDGGSNPGFDGDITVNEDIIVPNPTKPDNIFTGYEKEVDPDTGKITITATWKNTVDVTFNEYTDGTENTIPGSITKLPIGTVITVDNTGGTNPNFEGEITITVDTIVPDPTREGYIFTGYVQTTDADGKHTITATWKAEDTISPTNPETELPTRPDTTLPTITVVPPGATVTPDGLIIDENEVPLGWLPIPEGYDANEIVFDIDGTIIPKAEAIPQTSHDNNFSPYVICGLLLIGLCAFAILRKDDSQNY